MSQVPDSTAVRVALWRAMHVQVDPPPHVLNDEVGLKLIDPSSGWRDRPDMDPKGTAPFRASIVARARFIEDYIIDQYRQGLRQYVQLGAGIDTFAQRLPSEISELKIFEVDKPDTQTWKIERLKKEGFEIPSGLQFVPVNFEAKGSWWDRLEKSGFNSDLRAVVTSIGVSMYLTREAILETFQQMKSLASGSKFIMTFLLPLDLVESEDRPGYLMSMKGAEKSGTPFLSLFSPEEMKELVKGAGINQVEHFSTASLTKKYFSHRTDGLRPSTGEELLIVTL